MVLWLILEKIYSLIANDLHTKATTKVANSTLLALKINAPVTPLQKYLVEGGVGGWWHMLTTYENLDFSHLGETQGDHDKTKVGSRLEGRGY